MVLICYTVFMFPTDTKRSADIKKLLAQNGFTNTEMSVAVIDLNKKEPRVFGYNLNHFIYPASVYKIFVGAVAPGFVNTELTADRLNGPEGEQIKAQSPFNRVAEPEEVAHAVLFLASEGAEFSTGTIIDVNGASYLRS